MDDKPEDIEEQYVEFLRWAIVGDEEKARVILDRMMMADVEMLYNRMGVVQRYLRDRLAVPPNTGRR